MNKIKKLYLACKVRFGHLGLQELEDLCSIYIKFQDPRAAKVISRGMWKNLTRSDSEFFLKLYLHYHTADEGLLRSEWLLKNEHISHAYLRSLCTRTIQPTAEEEKWILNCKDSGAMLCLRYQLSAHGEQKLVQSGEFEKIIIYIECHTLRESGEAALAINASDKKDEKRAAEYRCLLCRYFEWQHRTLGRRIFTEFMAQWSLFADEANEELIMQVIEQCDMDNFMLESAVIKRMALEMSPKYLVWYLAQSYIPDKDLISELLRKNLPEHLHNMITVSEQRHAIHDLIKNSILFMSDDWRNDEREAYMRFSREDDAQKRMADLLNFLEPRIVEGNISPAMAAWVAARCPELASKMQLAMTRFAEKTLRRILLFNPFNSSDNPANPY